MVKWIVLAVVLFALLVLALAVRPVLARLMPLHQAALGLRRHQARAESLATNAGALQERLEDLQRQAGVAQRRLAAIRTKREN